MIVAPKRIYVLHLTPRLYEVNIFLIVNNFIDEEK
jgi:hypothetical protein